MQRFIIEALPYQINDNHITIYRNAKFLYISFVCISMSLIMSSDNNIYNSLLFPISNIYIYTELLVLLMQMFKMYISRIKKIVRITLFVLRIIWIALSSYGAEQIFEETETTNSIFYYMCIYIYISNISYIIILSILLLNYRGNYYFEENTDNNRRSIMTMINDATEIELFSNIVGITNETMCSICYEDFKNDDPLRILTCKHYFHDHCIDEWFKINITCPICRINVVYV